MKKPNRVQCLTVIIIAINLAICAIQDYVVASAAWGLALFCAIWSLVSDMKEDK